MSNRDLLLWVIVICVATVLMSVIATAILLQIQDSQLHHNHVQTVVERRVMRA